MSCSNSCGLNYDNAPCIPVRSKTDTSIQFSVFYPAPIDLSSGTFVFMLSTDERGDCRVKTVQQGEGLTVEAGALIDTQDPNKPLGQGTYGPVGETVNGYYISLFIPKNHGLLYNHYFGEVRHDVDDDNASIILKVQLEIESSIARLS